MSRSFLQLHRHFTSQQHSPFEQVQWRSFGNIEAPAQWSNTAVEIAAHQYLRKRVAGEVGGETSVRQLIHRVVRGVRAAGEWQGYFEGAAAQIFEDELAHILLHQMGSFNSPVYFNVGLFSEYGILGSGENYSCANGSGKAQKLSSAYLHPQASACFIQSVDDDLLSIFDLLKSEAKLFKYGSGTGTNFSRLRAAGEALEGGGQSTGLISYLEVFDKAAQAIKSGGTSRRAAKMVILDADHPEVLEFINWKMLEERKARVLLANGYGGGMGGEAFRTVSGQNANNSVRVSDDFLKRALAGEPWALRARTTQQVVRELNAKDVLTAIARAAWECADPGIQYHDTIQKWNLCKASGEIRASNPCSEYMFLDDSACNLASLNLVAFLKNDGLDWAAFRQCVRILLLAQEILVDYASYPTARIAENSHCFRPLGLGYANLGGLLMRLGIAYESSQATAWTAQITASLQAMALEMSSEMARFKGAFAGWSENRQEALSVLHLHAQAWPESSGLVRETLNRALQMAEHSGLRNAQLTLIAPTGTIGLFMDCDTLGIEPDYALVKRKHLASGQQMLLLNRSVGPALQRLGYTSGQIKDIEKFVRQTGAVVGAPGLAEKHFAIFDGAMPPAQSPERRVSALGHLQIMAAAQPFLSGAISKTVNLPSATSPAEIQRLFIEGWRLGLKSLAIYRDGSKALQPLCAEC